MGYTDMCGSKLVCFLTVLVSNRVSYLTILISNRIWFLHSSLE